MCKHIVYNCVHNTLLLCNIYKAITSYNQKIKFPRKFSFSFSFWLVFIKIFHYYKNETASTSLKNVICDLLLYDTKCNFTFCPPSRNTFRSLLVLLHNLNLFSFRVLKGLKHAICFYCNRSSRITK